MNSVKKIKSIMFGLRDIPTQVVSKILGSFVQISVEKQYKLNEYFGKFNGKGPIHQIFRSFSVPNESAMKLIPVKETLNVECWGDTFDLSVNFVKRCRNLTRLEGFMQLPTETLLELTRLPQISYLFFFNADNEMDQVIQCLNKMPHLVGIGVFNQREIGDSCTVDLDSKNLRMIYFDNLPANITMEKTPNVVDISIAHSFVTNSQLKNIATMKKLRNVLLCCCGYVEDGFSSVIERPQIESYNMKDCNIDPSVFSKIKLPPDSQIWNLGFEGCFTKKDIPITFIEQVLDLKNLCDVNFHRCRITRNFFEKLLAKGVKSKKKTVTFTFSSETIEAHKEMLVEVQKAHDNIDFVSFQEDDTDGGPAIECLETVPGYKPVE